MCMNKILTSLLCKCYKFSFVKCTSDGCMAGITLCGGVAATKTHATPHLVIFTHEPMRGVTLVRRNRRVPQHAAATQTRRRRSQRRINQIMERKSSAMQDVTLEGQVTSGSRFDDVLFLFIQSIQGRLELKKKANKKHDGKAPTK